MGNTVFSPEIRRTQHRLTRRFCLLVCTSLWQWDDLLRKFCLQVQFGWRCQNLTYPFPFLSHHKPATLPSDVLCIGWRFSRPSVATTVKSCPLLLSTFLVVLLFLRVKSKPLNLAFRALHVPAHLSILISCHTSLFLLHSTLDHPSCCLEHPSSPCQDWA